MTYDEWRNIQRSDEDVAAQGDRRNISRTSSNVRSRDAGSWGFRMAQMPPQQAPVPLQVQNEMYKSPVVQSLHSSRHASIHEVRQGSVRAQSVRTPSGWSDGAPGAQQYSFGTEQRQGSVRSQGVRTPSARDGEVPPVQQHNSVNEVQYGSVRSRSVRTPSGWADEAPAQPYNFGTEARRGSVTAQSVGTPSGWSDGAPGAQPYNFGTARQLDGATAYGSKVQLRMPWDM